MRRVLHKLHEIFFFYHFNLTTSKKQIKVGRVEGIRWQKWKSNVFPPEKINPADSVLLLIQIISGCKWRLMVHLCPAKKIEKSSTYRAYFMSSVNREMTSLIEKNKEDKTWDDFLLNSYSKLEKLIPICTHKKIYRLKSKDSASTTLKKYWASRQS